MYKRQNNEDGSLNTQRRFNFDNPNGLIFPYGYSSDRYWFRPWFRPYDEPDYTLYRKGMEIGDGVHKAEPIKSTITVIKSIFV